MEELIQENEELEESGLYEHYRLTVDPGQSAIRIDKFLSNRIENASRSRIQAAADAGNILVNGKAVKPNYKVKPNEEILIVMDYPRRELKIIAEATPGTVARIIHHEANRFQIKADTKTWPQNAIGVYPILCL